MMIFATLLLSQMDQAQSLPDEIDYVTYRAVMQMSLDESNALQGKANVIQSQIANLELQISKNQDLIQSSNARIELQRLDILWRSIRDQGEHAKAELNEVLKEKLSM